MADSVMIDIENQEQEALLFRWTCFRLICTGIMGLESTMINAFMTDANGYIFAMILTILVLTLLLPINTMFEVNIFLRTKRLKTIYTDHEDDNIELHQAYHCTSLIHSILFALRMLIMIILFSVIGTMLVLIDLTNLPVFYILLTMLVGSAIIGFTPSYEKTLIVLD